MNGIHSAQFGSLQCIDCVIEYRGGYHTDIDIGDIRKDVSFQLCILNFR